MTEILDERAVSEIEAQNKINDLIISPEINALCATVKHLREVNQGIIDGIADGKKIFSDQITSLQSQLEQLRAENERLKSNRMIVRDDAERFIKQYLHSAQWEGERLMITFENESLIAALIGDVEKL